MRTHTRTQLVAAGPGQSNRATRLLDAWSRERGVAAVSSLLRYPNAMERDPDLIQARSAAGGKFVLQFLSKSSKENKIIQKGKS
jgi:hypothetical protein